MNVKITLLREVILWAIVDVFGGYKPDDEKADKILQKIKVSSELDIGTYMYIFIVI